MTWHHDQMTGLDQRSDKALARQHSAALSPRCRMLQPEHVTALR
ncbi:MAG: hypothetical protein AB3N12_03510 [Ruegeria sp.]